MGSVNYITTIIKLRAPGMTMFRLPMTVWAMFITAMLQAFALPVLTAALIMQLLDRTARHQLLHARSAGRSANAPPVVGGGQPLLWQHLFWFYSHPAVYIMILPAMGMVSDIIATLLPQAALRLQADGLLDRRHRRAWASSSGATTCSSRGMNPTLGTTFMISTMMIALPVGHQGLQLARARCGAATSSSPRRC